MIKKILLAILLFSSLMQLRATHLMGGYMSYEYMGKSGNNYAYRISMKMYRDCKGSSVPFEKSALICVYNANKKLYRSFDFDLKTESKVNPIGNTNCPTAKSSCIKEGFFEKIISLPRSTTGYYIVHKTCCRNKQVNLTNDGGGEAYQGQIYSAFIPPTHIKNSSPFFSEIPVPFFCFNDTTEIRNTAIDPDGDSLVFKSVKPNMGITSTQWGSYTSCNRTETFPPNTVVYKPGYSATKPFGNGGYENVNSRTGLATLFSRRLGNFAYCIEVSEYRNGILLSKVRLDYQLLVLNCKPNKKPYLTNNTSKQTVRYEVGENKCIPIEGADINNDNIRISGIGDILSGLNGFNGTKATFKTVEGKGPLKTKFCWKPDCDAARKESYLFTVEVLDDGCPSKYINKIFEVYVDSFKSKIGISGSKNVCENSNHVYAALGKGTNNTVNWIVEGGVITNGQGTKNINIKWGVAGVGKVKIIETSQFGCLSPEKVYLVDIKPSPPLPTFNKNIDTICLDKEATFAYTGPVQTSYNWYVQNAQIMGSNTGNSVKIKFNKIGDAFIKLVTKNATGCPSDTGFIKIFIPKFSLGVIDGPDNVCPNNQGFKYTIAPNAGSKYHWFVTGGTIQSGDGTNDITVKWGDQGIGILKVVEENKHGCKSDTIKLIIDKTYNLNPYKITGPIDVCENQNTNNLYESFVASGKYDWVITGGTEVNNDSLYTVEVLWGVKGQGKVWLQYFGYDTLNSKLCKSTPTTLLVNIHPLPTADKVIGNMNYCQFDPIAKFTINGFVNSTYEWTVNGDNNVTGQGTNSITYSTDKHGIYTIKVIEKSEHNCEGTPIDTTFVIHPKPTTTPIIGDAPICFPDYTHKNFVYTTTGFTNSTFNWTISNGTIINNNNDNIVAKWTGPLDGKLNVQEISEFNCKGDTQWLDIPLDNPNVFLKYITVNPPEGADNSLLVYWSLNNAPRYNSKIYIFRKEFGTATFTLIDSVNKNTTYYQDFDVKPKEKSYIYQIRGYNICNYPIETKEHTSVLLTGNKVGVLGNEVSFTAYIGWANGVKEYELHRKTNEGTYALYDNNAIPTKFTYENGKDGYRICYRVKSLQDGDSNFVSWSNEKCFVYEPVVFVPNAFTPDGNNDNDFFKYVASSVKTFKMQVFNRWGEKVFETQDNEKYWDGQYKGVTSQAGVYVYLLQFTDYQNKLYKLNGTVHLIR